IHTHDVDLHSCPTRRSSDLGIKKTIEFVNACQAMGKGVWMYSGDSGIGTAAYLHVVAATQWLIHPSQCLTRFYTHDVIEEGPLRSEEHTSELQSRENLVCRL